jgi:hypothetical protein
MSVTYRHMAGPFTPTVAPGPLSKRVRFGWVLEVAGVGACYQLYDRARDWVMGTRVEAFRNARLVTRIEVWLGIYHEKSIQQFFLDYPFLVTLWNIYYGTAHFAVPLFAGIYLYVKFPERYVRWRNTFLFILVLGPIGWLFFPLTPPKYLPERYGFVDTPAEYFNFGPQRPVFYGPDGEPSAATIEEFGNIYSGMPSHHVSWALWSVLALWPVVRRRWIKGLLALHLVLTIGSIAVTGNHHLIDVFGSIGEVAVAYACAVAVDRLFDRLRARRTAGVAPDVVPPDPLAPVSTGA